MHESSWRKRGLGTYAELAATSELGRIRIALLKRSKFRSESRFVIDQETIGAILFGSAFRAMATFGAMPV